MPVTICDKKDEKRLLFFFLIDFITLAFMVLEKPQKQLGKTIYCLAL